MFHFGRKFRWTCTVPGLLRLGILVAALCAAPVARAQFVPGFPVDAQHAILVDYASGTVLYEKDADTPWPPASLAKLMTMEIVFAELKAGDLRIDEELVVSENAWRRGGAPSGGSTMFAAVHSRIKVEDLIRGAIVHSGNDACIVFAEALAGNEDLFARRMNERARELGLRSAEFRNATGLADPEQVISVRDLAKLAAHIIRTYPEFYRYYGEREFTWNKIKQSNRNPLLAMNLGADGMKTGFIKESGYGLVGSAVQDGRRLIVVLNGGSTAKDRADDAKRLLEWGFRNFESRLLFTANARIADARVFGGEQWSVPLVSPTPVYLLSPRDVPDKFVVRATYLGPLPAPVKIGSEVARLKVLRGGRVALDVPLYAGADVPAGGLMRRATDGALELAVGWARGALKSVLNRRDDG